MKKWKVLNKSKVDTQNILKVLLKNRGLITKKQISKFLNPHLENISVTSVGIDKKEVAKTIKRMEDAINKNENIVIYGDYDVDGICATAILWETIYSFYKNVTPYIPHRIDEGYGLSKKGILNIKSQIPNAKLIITVDNGIVAHEAVEFANKNGIDVIITDHHVASGKSPKAYSIIHSTKICGAGVAYLLSKEISKIHNSEFIIQNLLELVSLATVADMVPLIGANRTLLVHGLKIIKQTKRVGLIELFKQSGIKKELSEGWQVGVYEIGHVIAPRLNAAGRMEHAIDGLRLICTNSKDRAEGLAKKLSETNRDRQILTEEMRFHAENMSEKIDISEKIIFVHDESYSQGVIGLIASRLVEKHYRPSFVVSVGEKISKGSARSIKGFNIIEFIRMFDKYLVNAGGHPMAAGFILKTSKVKSFKKALEEKAREFIQNEQLVRIIEVDLEIDFDLINLELFNIIQKLAPFGQKNPEPIFVTKDAKVLEIRKIGKENVHLKMKLEKDGKILEALGFSLAEKFKLNKEDGIDIVYSLGVNEWNGKKTLQLSLKDIRLKN